MAVWTVIDRRDIKKYDKTNEKTNCSNKAHYDTDELSTLILEIKRYIWQ